MEDTLNINARAVLDVLRASPDHPTALGVYETVRRTRPRIILDHDLGYVFGHSLVAEK